MYDLQKLAPEQIASVVTYLEFKNIPTPNQDVLIRQDLSLQRQTDMSCSAYRDMFRDIGQHWLWFSRLQMNDYDLGKIIHHPNTELHTLHNNEGEIIGFLELNCTNRADIEISFMGVKPDAIGRGLGSFLMAHAFRIASVYATDRLWVHTCTLDHPSALVFYQKMGFEVYGRSIEIARDPRLDGTLPRTAAPQVPILS